MFHAKNVIGMLLITCLFSFHFNKRKMKQIYYTKEGTPYELKVINKNLDNVNPAFPVFINPALVVNAPIVDPTSITEIFVEQQNPIIPLMLYYTIIDIGGPNAVEVMSVALPYYVRIDLVNTQKDISYLKGLSKCMPMIESLRNNDVNTTTQSKYGLKYGQILLSDSDFNPVSASRYLFTSNLSTGLTGQGIGPTFQIPAGLYNIGMTVIYFELVKN